MPIVERPACPGMPEPPGAALSSAGQVRHLAVGSGTVRPGRERACADDRRLLAGLSGERARIQNRGPIVPHWAHVRRLACPACR